MPLSEVYCLVEYCPAKFATQFQRNTHMRVSHTQEEVILADGIAFDAKVKQKIDLVNHPPHYAGNPDGIECIQVTRHMNFNLGNAVKYLWRADKKDAQIQDLRKAIWYIEDEIKRLGVEDV